MSLNLKTQEPFKDKITNKMQREIKVPISSEEIADMTDMMLADQMQRLSINDVPIYEIDWGNKRLRYILLYAHNIIISGIGNQTNN